jgi:hypothetical protein
LNGVADATRIGDGILDLGHHIAQTRIFQCGHDPIFDIPKQVANSSACATSTTRAASPTGTAGIATATYGGTETGQDTASTTRAASASGSASIPGVTRVPGSGRSTRIASCAGITSSTNKTIQDCQTNSSGHGLPSSISLVSLSHINRQTMSNGKGSTRQDADSN